MAHRVKHNRVMILAQSLIKVYGDKELKRFSEILAIICPDFLQSRVCRYLHLLLLPDFQAFKLI